MQATARQDGSTRFISVLRNGCGSGVHSLKCQDDVPFKIQSRQSHIYNESAGSDGVRSYDYVETITDVNTCNGTSETLVSQGSDSVTFGHPHENTRGFVSVGHNGGTLQAGDGENPYFGGDSAANVGAALYFAPRGHNGFSASPQGAPGVASVSAGDFASGTTQVFGATGALTDRAAGRTSAELSIAGSAHVGSFMSQGLHQDVLGGAIRQTYRHTGNSGGHALAAGDNTLPLANTSFTLSADESVLQRAMTSAFPGAEAGISMAHAAGMLASTDASTAILDRGRPITTSHTESAGPSSDIALQQTEIQQSRGATTQTTDGATQSTTPTAPNAQAADAAFATTVQWNGMANAFPGDPSPDGGDDIDNDPIDPVDSEDEQTNSGASGNPEGELSSETHANCQCIAPDEPVVMQDDKGNTYFVDEHGHMFKINSTGEVFALTEDGWILAGELERSPSSVEPTFSRHVYDALAETNQPHNLLRICASFIPVFGTAVSAAEMAIDEARSVSDETSTVIDNTAHLGLAERIYVVTGTSVASLAGVRQISDAFSRHDAVDGHEQCVVERVTDGVTGSVTLVGSAAGLRVNLKGVK